MTPPLRWLLVSMVFAYAFCPVLFVSRTGDCQRFARQTLRAVRIKQAKSGSDDWRSKDLRRGGEKGFGGSLGGRRGGGEQSWQDDDIENRRPGGGAYSDYEDDPEWETDSEEMAWKSGRQQSQRGDRRSSGRPAGGEDRYSDSDNRGWGGGFEEKSRSRNREQHRGFGDRYSDSDDRGRGGGFEETSRSRSREQHRGFGDDRRHENRRSQDGGSQSDDEQDMDVRGWGFGGKSEEFRTWSDDEWRMNEDDIDRDAPQSWSEDETMKVEKNQGFYNVWQTVWVRGFDFKTPESRLRKHLATAGDLVDFWFDPRAAALARFKSIEAARNAVTKLDGTTLEGNKRYIDVLLRSEMATQPVLEESSVFVDGFDYGTRAAGLMKHFRSAGKVLEVDMLTKSSAIVQFESESGAEAAFDSLDQTTVPGNRRYLRVLPVMPAAISLWGFDYETTKEDIVKHCSQAGEVLYAFKESRGSSIVQYGSLAEAKRAIKMLDKTYMVGQKRYVAAQLHNINRRVFVSNLPVNTNWQDLKDHMRAAGDILFCNIVPNPEKRRGSKGDYGLVEYATTAEAQDAISKLSRSKFDGNKIFVQPDRDLTQREKTSLFVEYNREQGIEGESAAQEDVPLQSGSWNNEEELMEDDPRIPSFASAWPPRE